MAIQNELLFFTAADLGSLWRAHLFVKAPSLELAKKKMTLCLLCQLLLISVLAAQCPAVSGLFDWLRQKETPPAVIPPSSLEPNAKDAPAFEMTVIDEKFLAEAKQMDLSPLDSCHYRVVAKLKSTCESLSEEQLAKLGVVLFNCQAQVEGRRTYPCTEEMTIKQCTADMDADTWNAYHIVGNRARSVCYATRQQHFRRRAELTVNALISTATSQLDAMQDLKEGQVELKELTAASLDKLLQGHSALQAQQEHLWEGQGQLESSMKANLEQLGQEKALIASGQQLVAQLIQGITQRLENVSEQVKDQGSEVQESHKAIVQDLSDVRDRAQDIYHKIDHSMVGFLQYQGQTAQYYTDVMSKLERMNGTLGFLMRCVDNMQGRIEERLHVIQSYLGWAGMSLTAMWTCIVHAGYFLLCAVLLAFLQCPLFSRALLLLTVPLNTAAQINQQPALDLTALSMLLVTLSLGHWFVRQLLWACSCITQKSAKSLPLPPCKMEEPEKQQRPYNHHIVPPSSTPIGGEQEGYMDEDSVIFGDPGISAQAFCQSDPLLDRFVPIMDTPNQSTPRHSRRPGLSVAEDIALRNLGGVFDSVNDSRSASPNQSVTSNSSLSGRQLCSGVTKTGKACKKRAVPGQEYCRIHEGSSTSYMHI